VNDATVNRVGSRRINDRCRRIGFCVCFGWGSIATIVATAVGSSITCVVATTLGATAAEDAFEQAASVTAATLFGVATTIGSSVAPIVVVATTVGSSVAALVITAALLLAGQQTAQKSLTAAALFGVATTIGSSVATVVITATRGFCFVAACSFGATAGLAALRVATASTRAEHSVE
jgi:hypothetical protein